MYLAEYVTIEHGTGIVHSSPAYGVDDFNSCRRYGLGRRYAEARCRATAATRPSCRSSAA
jgi:isoleucyl-tRNA synthetase